MIKKRDFFFFFIINKYRQGVLLIRTHLPCFISHCPEDSIPIHIGTNYERRYRLGNLKSIPSEILRAPLRVRAALTNTRT